MDKIDVPYIAHESSIARMERTNQRLWILCLVLIFSLIATNLAWIIYESQWEVYEETTTQEVTQSAESAEGNAVNKFVGGDYGESYTDDQNNND